MEGQFGPSHAMPQPALIFLFSCGWQPPIKATISSGTLSFFRVRSFDVIIYSNISSSKYTLYFSFKGINITV
jgi:hypothetical protein